MQSGENSQGDTIPVIDAHVHGYPPEVIADPAGFASRQKEPHWGQLVSDGPQGWADPDELVRAMDAGGIDQVLLQAWYWENPDTAVLQNAWHAEWVARHPDRFRACAAVHPAMADPEAVLEHAREWGACAVGECLPQVQSAAGWEDPAWERILNWTTAEGWPFCLHLTEPVGHSYPGRIDTPLMDTVRLFETHPRQKWLCAHWGGGLPFHSLNHRVARALENVWFDTAASPLLYNARIWRTVVDLVGPQKVLLGSDFPLRLYRGTDHEGGWLRFLEELRTSGLTEAEQDAICSANFRTLFR